MLKEIENEEDVALLVKTFYGSVVNDPLLKPHFEGIDWEAHLPRMTAFWDFILLDKAGFTGNVFDKHANLNIGAPHFTAWLKIFFETVDSLFIGEKAEMAKQRAESIGMIFQHKMK
ncbi:MAG: group III truncated hemoglobin [Bacteroidia bacterium]|nr:group III truncated hemoglobin [Bacteroidia bacterium]